MSDQGVSYSPLAHLNRFYYSTKPSLAFKAQSVDEWRKWRRALKGKLKSISGGRRWL